MNDEYQELMIEEPAVFHPDGRVEPAKTELVGARQRVKDALKKTLPSKRTKTLP